MSCLYEAWVFVPVPGQYTLIWTAIPRSPEKLISLGCKCSTGSCLSSGANREGPNQLLKHIFCLWTFRSVSYRYFWSLRRLHFILCFSNLATNVFNSFYLGIFKSMNFSLRILTKCHYDFSQFWILCQKCIPNQYLLIQHDLNRLFDRNKTCSEIFA